MSKSKRFILCQNDFDNYEIRYDDKVFHFLWEVAPILNTQQAKIHRDEMSIKTMMSNMEKLEKENDELQKQVKRLQELAKRTEEEKEHFADLYNQCRRYKLSDEAIKQAYADLNRREREKHSQGNVTYVAKNQNEVFYYE